MPVPHRLSEANLRKARSIPTNILQRTNSKDTLRDQPEIARQLALAAANRAFHLAQVAKGAPIKREEDVKVTPTMSRKQTLPQTDEASSASAVPTVASDGVNPSADGGDIPDRPIEQAAAPGALCTNGSEDRAVTVSTARKVSGSGQSSFQRMHKPKSMFSLRKRATAETFSPPGTPGRATPTLRRSPRRSADTQQFPTGFSPGRPMPTAAELLQRLPNSYQTTYDQNRAVQLARDEYVRRINDEANQSPTPVQSDRPKIVKHFRHTLRRGGNLHEEAGDSTEDPIGGSKVNKLETKSRSRRISQGFRATLRRIFRGNPSPSFPAQQVDATRKHYNSAHDDEVDDPNDPIRHPIIPAPCPEMVARLSYRQSHDTVVPSPASIRYSHPPSIRSMRSNESLRTASRITSWTNSTTSKGTNPTSGVDSQNAERARLSVIQENAPHRPSSSTLRQRGFESSRAPFQQPMRPMGDAGDVDTEKLAQGLRDNIQRKRVAAESGNASYGLESNSEMPDRSDSQTVRRRSRRPALRTELTDSDDEWVPSSRLMIRKQRGITYPSSDEDDVFEPSIPRHRGQPIRALHHKLSLQDIADLNEGSHAPAKQSLRESRSTFFPGKGQYPNFQASPYRKAMSVTVVKDSVDTQSLDREITPESQESASVYSRRTSGTPYARVVLDDAARSALPGTAYVEENPVSHYRTLVGRARGASGVSHRSSGSWKGWMASEVSKLEGANDYTADIHMPMEGPGLKDIDHVRKPAHHEFAREHADAPEDGTARSVSGARPALDTMRFFSGLRIPKRNASGESKDTASRRSSFSIKEDSDAASSKSRFRVLLPGLRVSSNEGNPAMPRIPTLSHKASEPALKLPTVPESPMTPFSKFMASDPSQAGGSPLEGYHLRERAVTGGNTHHSPERDARLRRMQSSILAGNRPGHHGPNQYPWLQRYRDSHFYEEFSPADRENKPPGDGPAPRKDQATRPLSYTGSMEDDPFPDPNRLAHRAERSSSGEMVFI